MSEERKESKSVHMVDRYADIIGPYRTDKMFYKEVVIVYIEQDEVTGKYHINFDNGITFEELESIKPVIEKLIEEMEKQKSSENDSSM